MPQDGPGQTGVDRDIRLRQALIEYGVELDEASYLRFKQVLLEEGIFEAFVTGYGRVAELPGEVATYGARSTLQTTDQIRDQNVAFLMEILRDKKGFLEGVIGASKGWIGFAQGLVTVLKMIVPEDSTIAQTLTQFEDKLMNLSNDLTDRYDELQTSARIDEALGIIRRGQTSAIRATQGATADYRTASSGMIEDADGIIGDSRFTGELPSPSSAATSSDRITLASFRALAEGEGIDMSAVVNPATNETLGDAIDSLDTDSDAALAFANATGIDEITQAIDLLPDDKKSAVEARVYRQMGL